MSIFSMLQGKSPMGGTVGTVGGQDMMGYDPTVAQAGSQNALAQPLMQGQGGGVFNAVRGQRPAQAGSQADVMARAHGFPDAATMMAWSQHRSDSLRSGDGGTSAQSGQGGGGGLSMFDDNSGKYVGPAGAFMNWVHNKISGATGN